MPFCAPASRVTDLTFSNRRGAWTETTQSPPAPSRRSAIVVTLVRMVLLVFAGGFGASGCWLIVSATAGRAETPSNWTPATPHTSASLRDALPIGMEEGITLYACRGSLDGTTQIGRYRKDFGGCHVGYGGKEMEIATFELLGTVWMDGAAGTGLSPLVAGSTVHAETMPVQTAQVFVCRATFHGAIHVGSTDPTNNRCAFGFGGQIINSQNYSVLQAAPWLTWVAATPGTLPADAVVGGEEGREAFLICRAATKHGLLAGKIKASASGCSVPSENTEAVEAIFEILVPRWQVGNGGAIPVAGFIAGYDHTNLLYPCRANHRGTVQLGRANDGLGGCHVGIQSKEVSLRDYEILVQ